MRMKYSVVFLICAALTCLSFVLSVLCGSLDFPVYMAIVFVPLAVTIPIFIVSNRKHPEWQRFNRALETWRIKSVKVGAFFISLAAILIAEWRLGVSMSMSPSIIFMLLADFAYRHIISLKLDFDRLGSVDAILKERPEAARYFVANVINSGRED